MGALKGIQGTRKAGLVRGSALNIWHCALWLGARLSAPDTRWAALSLQGLGASQRIQLLTEPLRKELVSSGQLLEGAEACRCPWAKGLSRFAFDFAPHYSILGWHPWCADPWVCTRTQPTLCGWAHGSCLAGPVEGNHPGSDRLLLRRTLGTNLPPPPPSVRRSNGISVGDGVREEAQASLQPKAATSPPVLHHSLIPLRLSVKKGPQIFS